MFTATPSEQVIPECNNNKVAIVVMYTYTGTVINLAVLMHWTFHDNIFF